MRHFTLLDDGEIVETPYPIDGAETRKARRRRNGREIVREWHFEDCTRLDLYTMLIEAEIVGNEMTAVQVHAARLDHGVDDVDIETFMSKMDPPLVSLENADGSLMVYPDTPRQAPIGSGATLWDALVDHYRARYARELEGVRRVEA